jgi:serine/threonine protein kinase
METEVPSLRNACRFINTRDFILRARLGLGGFAAVYRAEDKITGEVMALKVVNKCSAGPRQLYLVRMEAYAMKRVMGDPYCTEIRAAFQDEHKLYIALVSGRTSFGWLADRLSCSHFVQEVVFGA